MVRWFHEAEVGELTAPMAPLFDPLGAGNGYAVTISDPDLLYRERLDEGLKGAVRLQIETPAPGSYIIMGRVRAPDRDSGNALFVTANNESVGGISVRSSSWRWEALDRGAVFLPGGSSQLEFSAHRAGISLDMLLVTNDPNFAPEGKGNAPRQPPTQPQNLRVEQLVSDSRKEALQWRGHTVAPPYVKLRWELSRAPQEVRYYSVHRSRTRDFKADRATLLGSPNDPAFIDLGMSVGRYYYRVVGVDNWGNRSDPSAVLEVQISGPKAVTSD
jgi:hypothetical protein